MSIKAQLKRSLYLVLQNDNQGSFASRADRRQILMQLASDLINLGYNKNLLLKLTSNSLNLYYKFELIKRILYLVYYKKLVIIILKIL